MNIDGVHQVPEPPEAQRLRKAAEKRTAQSSEKSEGSDEVRISEKAKAAATEIQLVKLVDQIDDVRPEVVEKAKQDIENGTLFSQDIAEKTAEEILRRI